jgi:hypothetical protein
LCANKKVMLIRVIRDAVIYQMGGVRVRLPKRAPLFEWKRSLVLVTATAVLRSLGSEAVFVAWPGAAIPGASLDKHAAAEPILPIVAIWRTVVWFKIV